MWTPGSVSTMNAIGLPTVWRPSESVPEDQWWHSTGRICSPAISTTMPQVVALTWSGDTPSSISIARTAVSQTTGAPVRLAIRAESP